MATDDTDTETAFLDRFGTLTVSSGRVFIGEPGYWESDSRSLSAELSLPAGDYAALAYVTRVGETADGEIETCVAMLILRPDCVSRDLDRMKAKFAAIQKSLAVLADNPADSDVAGTIYTLMGSHVADLGPRQDTTGSIPPTGCPVTPSASEPQRTSPRISGRWEPCPSESLRSFLRWASRG